MITQKWSIKADLCHMIKTVCLITSKQHCSLTSGVTFIFLQRSPLSTQDQNIMASKQVVKPQFVSKLRPPSAVKRPREQAYTNAAPPSCQVCMQKLATLIYFWEGNTW